MYETINNKQSEWGLEFYRVTPKYFDSRKEKQGKEPQSNIKIKYGERRHFLDEIAKQNCTPGSSNWFATQASTTLRQTGDAEAG